LQRSATSLSRFRAQLQETTPSLLTLPLLFILNLFSRYLKSISATYAPLLVLPSSMDPTSTSFASTFIRFIALYFTSLFSLDAYRAAANSPYRRLGTPNDTQQQRRKSPDHGEGATVGWRLDPGGPQQRRGGLSGGGDLNMPSCGSCQYPSVST